MNIFVGIKTKVFSQSNPFLGLYTKVCLIYIQVVRNAFSNRTINDPLNCYFHSIIKKIYQPLKKINMKVIVAILILVSSLNSFSQTDKVIGDYKSVIETNENNILEYELTLSQDGTFLFHYYSNIKQGIPPEVNKYGKGKWTIENNVISFFSDKQKDIDNKNTLDFTNSKARFIIKSPRNKTDQIIKTRLQFLKSEIFWMEKIEIFKI